MSSTKKVVLVTGGNSGIGFELCNQLLASGRYQVLLASRSLDKGKEAVEKLQSRGQSGSIEAIELDVTKDETIEQAAKQVETKYGKLDVLVNNAGIAGPQTPLRESMQNAFNANATGVAVVTEAFAPLLKKAATESKQTIRIINVSTGGASISMRLDPNAFGSDIKHIPYRTSKAALSMVSACQVAEYRNDGIKVFMYSPGFTESNLGPYNKVSNGAKPVDVAVRPLVDILEGKRDDEAGLNLHADGVNAW